MGAQAHKATRSAKPAEGPGDWYVIDATDQVLGRLATRIASVLRGKHRADFTPHVDLGDHVVVVNAEKVRLTGRKLEQKTYYRHSGWAGGLRSITAGKLLASAHPERIVESAVRGMLPKGPLGRKLYRKLRVYSGGEHPHSGQQPKELSLG